MAINCLLIIGSVCIIISTILMGLLGPMHDRNLDNLRGLARQYKEKVTYLIQDHYAYQNMETRGLNIRNIITVLESINKILKSKQLFDVIESRQKEMMITKYQSLATLSQKLDYSNNEINSWSELNYDGLENQKLECMKKYKKSLGETLESLHVIEENIRNVIREKSNLLYITLFFQILGLTLILLSKI